MFELAVTGPIVTSGFGIARQCIECRRAWPGNRCSGFGAGCLGYGPQRREASGGGTSPASASSNRSERSKP